jgi:hypothetical protein
MFIVIELQTNGGKVSTITTAYEDENTAYQKYYQILSFAAVSTVDVHSACVMNEYCGILRSETFDHRTTDES